MVSVFLSALFLDAGVLPCSSVLSLSVSLRLQYLPCREGGSGPAAPSFYIIAE